MPQYFYKMNIRFGFNVNNKKEAEEKLDKILDNIINNTAHVSGGLYEEEK